MTDTCTAGLRRVRALPALTSAPVSVWVTITGTTNHPRRAPGRLGWGRAGSGRRGAQPAAAWECWNQACAVAAYPTLRYAFR